jgi:hypothetical protein
MGSLKNPRFFRVKGGEVKKIISKAIVKNKVIVYNPDECTVLVWI